MGLRGFRCSLKNPTFRGGGFPNDRYRGRGLPEKEGGFGQFADLRMGGAWQERPPGGVFEGRG